MARIGNHMKMHLPHRLRQRAREFYADVLGCKELEDKPYPDLDLYEFEDGFVIGLFFLDDTALLSEEEHEKATWLEIKVADPDGMTQRLREFGIAEVDFADKTRFYFRAPGGQVFRLAPMEGGL